MNTMHTEKEVLQDTSLTIEFHAEGSAGSRIPRRERNSSEFGVGGEGERLPRETGPLWAF